MSLIVQTGVVFGDPSNYYDPAELVPFDLAMDLLKFYCAKQAVVNDKKPAIKMVFDTMPTYDLESQEISFGIREVIHYGAWYHTPDSLQPYGKWFMNHAVNKIEEAARTVAFNGPISTYKTRLFAYVAGRAPDESSNWYPTFVGRSRPLTKTCLMVRKP